MYTLKPKPQTCGSLTCAIWFQGEILSGFREFWAFGFRLEGLASCWRCPEKAPPQVQVLSHSLNSLKGYMGDYIGDCYRGYMGDYIGDYYRCY